MASYCRSRIRSTPVLRLTSWSSCVPLIALSLGVLTANRGAYAQAPVTPVPHRVYMQLLEPREHPDYARRAVQPPSWDTFNNQTQFATLRGFNVDTNNRLVDFVAELDKHTKTNDLGSVIWPSHPTVFAENLADLADEIKSRNLFLFDIWGYVPGGGNDPRGSWSQYKPSPEALAMLESKLGERWLGMDVGEQDGRYVGGYASQLYPMAPDRFGQYLNFQRHFEHMGNELGNRLSTLVSLNFGHYLLKEGTYATIGAETAQALPNSQVYYAFIRGAGKQYGVPWFGNASVWNRWGYKSYGATGDNHGPTKGTSLNLLKRLLYTQILYNSVFVGFESSWFDGDKLSPVGEIQQSAQRWVRENGQPGVMQTPVALLLDFYSGWTFPRHLYTDKIYRVWGNLPYEPGDFFTDGVLDLLYPGYQDASYFHDERGFNVATPFGDIADCLLSDAPLWVHNRYPHLVIAGDLAPTVELRDKLESYVRNGGHLTITAGNIAKYHDGFASIVCSPKSRRMEGGQTIVFNDTSITEVRAFDVYDLTLPSGATVIARLGETPMAADVALGKGTIRVLASAFGIASEPAVSAPISNANDTALTKPYPLLEHVATLLRESFSTQMLFEAGDGLSIVTCRKGPGVYTIGVCNNEHAERPFSIESHVGEITGVRELVMDLAEQHAVGYLPDGSEHAVPGTDSEKTIAGGSVRIFEVSVREANVVETPHVAPGVAPNGRILTLRGPMSVQEQVLSRSTFFEHFDGVCVDWRYLHERTPESLRAESGWLARQGLRLVVDLTSGLNLYPNLRLLNNDQSRFEESMAVIGDVVDKMAVIGSSELIVSLHQTPETNTPREVAMKLMEDTLRELCGKLQGAQGRVFLRVSPKSITSLEKLSEMLTRIGADNLFLAPSTALLARDHIAPSDIPDTVRSRIGLWMVGAPQEDFNGKLWSIQGPVYSSPFAASIQSQVASQPDVPVMLDAVYPNWDAEYLDARLMATAK